MTRDKCPKCNKRLGIKIIRYNGYLICRCGHKEILKARDWYSPSEIIYDQTRIIWMIDNIIDLEAGAWMPEPIETGYTGSQKIPFLKAPYETICCVRSELDIRLKMLSRDARETLIDTVYNGVKEPIIMKSENRTAYRALRYICGDWRKKQTYGQWSQDTPRYIRKRENNLTTKYKSALLE